MREKPIVQNHNESRSIEPHIRLDRDWVLNAKADYAKELVRSGMYGGVPGKCLEQYQEMRAWTTAEVVQRACDLTDDLFNEFERRGWIMFVPMYDDMMRELREKNPPEVGFLSKVAAR